MGGMCIGSLWLPRFVAAARAAAARATPRSSSASARSESWRSIVIPGVGHLYVAASGTADLVLRAVTAAVCLLPATILMGATLPAVARCVEGERNASAWLGACYAANILGGVLGCTLERVLPAALLRRVRRDGRRGAAERCGGDRRVAPACAGARCRRAPLPLRTRPRGPRGRFMSPRESPASRRSRPKCCGRGISRSLIGGTVYAFALMLAVFLLGLGAGSGAGAALGARLDPRRALAVCQWLLAAAIAWAAYAIARSLPYWPLDVALPTPAERGARARRAARCVRGAARRAALGRVVSARAGRGRRACDGLAPGRRARLRREHGGRDRGRAAHDASCSSPGSAASARSSSRWCSPRPSAWRCGSRPAAGRRCATQAVIAAAVAVALAYSVPALPPELVAYGRFLPTRGVGANVVYVGEGLTASVAVTREPSGVLTYHNAGKTQASTYPQDLRLQRMLGHLSTLVADKPADVLVIGLGAGITAGAVSIDPAVERVVVAEIEPLVPPLAAQFFAAHNFGVVHEPEGRDPHRRRPPLSRDDEPQVRCDHVGPARPVGQRRRDALHARVLAAREGAPERRRSRDRVRAAVRDGRGRRAERDRDVLQRVPERRAVREPRRRHGLRRRAARPRRRRADRRRAARRTARQCRVRRRRGLAAPGRIRRRLSISSARSRARPAT